MKKTKLFALSLSLMLGASSVSGMTAIGENIDSTAAVSDANTSSLSESEKIKDTVKEYIAKTGSDIIPVEYYWEFDFSDVDEKSMAEAEKYIILHTGYIKGTEEFEKEVKKKYIELTMDTPDTGYAAQKKRLLDSIGFDKEVTLDIIGDKIQQMDCELTVEQINQAAQLEQTWSIYTPMKYIAGPKEEETDPPSDVPKIEGLSNSEKISRTVNDYISRTGNTIVPGYICWVYDFTEIDENAMMKAIEYVDSLNKKLSVTQRKARINAKYYELTMDDEKYSYRAQEENIIKTLGIDITKTDTEKNTNGRIFSDLTIEQINKAAEMDQVTLIAVPADIADPQNTTGPASDVVVTTTTATSSGLIGTPEKIVYQKGEKLDLSGIKTADGKDAVIPPEEIILIGPVSRTQKYTANEFSSLEAGKYIVSAGDIKFNVYIEDPDSIERYVQLDNVKVISVDRNSGPWKVRFKGFEEEFKFDGDAGMQADWDGIYCEKGDTVSGILKVSTEGRYIYTGDLRRVGYGGDSNCDGNVDMSDAVLIMQTIANPSKYKLTEQGSKNADMDGDGVTNADALAIQKKLLKLD